MNNKHLIKEIERLLGLFAIDILGSGDIKTKGFYVSQINTLILSEKNDLINKFSEIIGNGDPQFLNSDTLKEDLAWCKGREKLRKDLRAKLSQLEEVK